MPKPGSPPKKRKSRTRKSRQAMKTMGARPFSFHPVGDVFHDQNNKKELSNLLNVSSIPQQYHEAFLKGLNSKSTKRQLPDSVLEETQQKKWRTVHERSATQPAVTFNEAAFKVADIDREKYKKFILAIEGVKEVNKKGYGYEYKLKEREKSEEDLEVGEEKAERTIEIHLEDVQMPQARLSDFEEDTIKILMEIALRSGVTYVVIDKNLSREQQASIKKAAEKAGLGINKSKPVVKKAEDKKQTKELLEQLAELKVPENVPVPGDLVNKKKSTEKGEEKVRNLRIT